MNESVDIHEAELGIQLNAGEVVSSETLDEFTNGKGGDENE